MYSFSEVLAVVKSPKEPTTEQMRSIYTQVILERLHRSQATQDQTQAELEKVLDELATHPDPKKQPYTFLEAEEVPYYEFD